jgi:hypothetical protein
MLNNYIIDFTDKKPQHSFQILPFTVNGPTDPTSLTLHDAATTASTSLRLPGKNTKVYGELIAENLVHMMEHFAGDVPPQYPIAGQLWFDKSKNPSQLRIYHTKKYLVNHNLILAPGIIEITPINETDKNELLTLLVLDSKIRLFNSNDSGQQIELILIANSTYNSIANTISIYTAAQITSYNGWFLGGWEYIIQNNSKLYHDFDVNDYFLVNVPDPLQDTNVANKRYVDAAIILNSSGISFDVDAPSVGEILTFNGTNWVNVEPSDPSLNLVSSNGDVYITGSVYSNLLELATIDYVDSLVLSGGGATNLDQLTDVTLTLPNPNNILKFDGALWLNSELSVYENKIVFDSTSDFLVTVDNAGKLSNTIKGDYTAPLIFDVSAYANSEQIATQEFVYDFVENSVDLLSLTDTDINVTLNKPPILDNNSPSLFFEKSLYNSPAYPHVSLSNVLGKISSVIGQFTEPKQRTLIKYNNTFVEPSLINLDTSSYGTLNMSYVVDDGSLNVFVNGIKKHLSSHGWTVLEIRLNNSNKLPIYEGTPTNLNPGTTYGFAINVNGLNQVIVKVYGGDSQTYGELIDQINLIADYNTWGFPVGYIPEPPLDIPPTPIITQQVQSNYATNVVQDAITGANSWTNINESIDTPNNAFSTTILNNLASNPDNLTYRLRLNEFNFNLPTTATIKGVEVIVTGYADYDLDGMCTLWDLSGEVLADNGNAVAEKSFTLPALNTNNYTLDSASQSNNAFYIVGDATVDFITGVRFFVYDSIGNDGVYTVVTSTTLGEIIVSEPVPGDQVTGAPGYIEVPNENNKTTIIGSNTDNWNDADLTNVNINNAQFGIAITLTNNTTTPNVYAFIDSIQCIISFEIPQYNSYSFGAVLYNNTIKFISGIPGTSSSVEIQNIGGGDLPLFSSLASTPIDIDLIETVSSTNSIFVGNDMTKYINIGDNISIINSTSNNATFNVIDVIYDSNTNQTQLVVSGVLVDSTLDGEIHLPLSFIVNEYRTSPILQELQNALGQIINIITATNTVYVEGNVAFYFNIGGTLDIINSTNNDGTYNIVNIVYDSINNITEFVTVESVNESVIDGLIPYVIPAETINTNHAPQPITADINEIGRPGRLSTSFEFVTGKEPAHNDLVEIIIEPKGFYDPL